jgi:glutaredoxin
MRPEPPKYIACAPSLSPAIVPQHRIGDNRSMELLVYSAEWCRDCREAKRFLATHSIPYKEINIETTPGAAEEVIAKTGKRGIPQFVLDGKWIQPYKPGKGFLHDEMAELFGVEQP